MKIIAVVSVLGLSFATPLLAQTAAAPAAPEAAMPKISIETPIQDLVANPAAKAVVEANFPGITAHPAYEQFKAMSLKALQPFSNGVITDAAIEKATAELAAVK
jgi:hypothetical protein